jgi:hypothetical protein
MAKHKPSNAATAANHEIPKWVLGTLYLVDLRLNDLRSGEKTKHKLLMVGCVEDDIERKLRWAFDFSKYDEVSITGVEKIKEKIHILSTTVTQNDTVPNAIIERDEGSQLIPHQKTITEPYDPHLYAVGIATTILAKDPEHAMRKVGHAIVASASAHSHTGATLSEDSTITIEEVSRGSGVAKPRDVSSEVNKAHFVRG